jgi:hypothetical protein
MADGNRVETSGIQTYTHKLFIPRLRFGGAVITWFHASFFTSFTSFLSIFTLIIIASLAQTGN